MFIHVYKDNSIYQKLQQDKLDAKEMPEKVSEQPEMSSTIMRTKETISH